MLVHNGRLDERDRGLILARWAQITEMHWDRYTGPGQSSDCHEVLPTLVGRGDRRAGPLGGATVAGKEGQTMARRRSLSSLFGKKPESDVPVQPSTALGADKPVMALRAQPDGKILVGGLFKTLCGQKRVGIGRLNPDCVLDAEFDPLVDKHVDAIALHQDGRILIGGGFLKVQGQDRRNIARLNSDGSLDHSFDFELMFIGGIAGFRHLLPLRTSGNILVAGGGARIQNKGFDQPEDIIILTENGSLEGTYKNRKRLGLKWAWSFAWDQSDQLLWTNERLAGIAAVVEQADGKLVMGGGFLGYTRRLNPDGTTDKSFVPSLDKYVTGVLSQEEGKFLVGGWFRDLGRSKRNYLVRLNPDGSLDETLPPWNPQWDRPILRMVSRNDGLVVVLQKDIMWERYSLTILDPASLRTVSTSDFKIAGSNTVNSLLAQDNGGIVIGGSITKFEGQKCSHILRLNPDGALDTSLEQRPAAEPRGVCRT